MRRSTVLSIALLAAVLWALVATGVIAKPALESGGTIPLIPPFERRISPWPKHFNMSIKGLDESPVPDNAEIVFMVKDVFTTRNGSWEPSEEYGAVRQWARDDYLKPFGAPDYFDDAGADHHLFAAVLGPDGELMRLKEIIYWSDGFDKLNDPNYDQYVQRQTKEHSGWINIPMFTGSSYVPERGESGPWCWMPTEGSEAICGGGLPANHHISTFVVWQAVLIQELERPKPGENAIFLPLITGAAPQ